MNEATYEPIREDVNLPASKADLHVLASGIEERFNNLPTREDFSQLLNSVDRLTGAVQIYNAERSAESERLRRIENWIKKASATINVPIEF